MTCSYFNWKSLYLFVTIKKMILNSAVLLPYTLSVLNCPSHVQQTSITRPNCEQADLSSWCWNALLSGADINESEITLHSKISHWILSYLVIGTNLTRQLLRFKIVPLKWKVERRKYTTCNDIYSHQLWS